MREQVAVLTGVIQPKVTITGAIKPKGISTIVGMVHQKGPVVGHLRDVVSLTGTVLDKSSVVGHLSKVVSVTGSVRSKVIMSASVIAPTLINLPAYLGPYDVIPEVTELSFETADKRMTDDMCVQAIPYHEVDNNYGTTVIIGGVKNG